MENQVCVGFYYMMGLLIEVREDGTKLVATMPGVPEGYEMQFEQLQDGQFRMRGGPADGSTVRFSESDTGEITSLTIGDYEIAKVDAEKAATLPYAERLTAPTLVLTPEKQAAFQNLLDGIVANSDGGWIDYALSHPKHEFVQYVMAQDIFVFHGSNDREIDTFAPVRTSVELYDKRGRGNLPAVYGTHDGLWAMFFAIVHRSKLRGSIRNGVMYVQNRLGEQLAVYDFSINREQLAEQPWTEGALYFLPRETFERQRLTAESYANEWTSLVPVKPIAKLSVQPEDFPFLQQIGGHDDGVLLRAHALGETLRSAAVTASLEGARFTVTVPDTEEMAGVLDEFVGTQSVLMPASEFSVEQSDAGLTLVVESLPPAYQHVYRKTYDELLA